MSARKSLSRGLGSSWFTERFHRNALVTHKGTSTIVVNGVPEIIKRCHTSLGNQGRRTRGRRDVFIFRQWKLGYVPSVPRFPTALASFCCLPTPAACVRSPEGGLTLVAPRALGSSFSWRDRSLHPALKILLRLRCIQVFSLQLYIAYYPFLAKIARL